MSKVYDSIVIGLGAMGSAALYQLSSTSKKVLGLDQLQPPHSLGSTHGGSRVTRQAIGEGRHYVPIVLRSNEIWRELESKTGEELFNTCGVVMFGENPKAAAVHGLGDFLEQTIQAAKAFDIQHEILDASALQKRYPQFHFSGNEVGYFEPGAGALYPERCVQTQLQLAQQQGAEVRYHQKVLVIEPKSNNDGVWVRTETETFEAETVMISVGSWIHQLLPSHFRKYFKTYRQTMYWFEHELSYADFSPDKLPVYVRFGESLDAFFYGFPALDGPKGGIKVAAEDFSNTSLPDTVQREILEEECKSMYRRVSRYLKIKESVLRATVCMYTVTPDFGFVLDSLPEHPQVLLVSPCSGHGFKHSAAIGQIAKEWLLTGQTQFDIDAFSLKRFGSL